MTAPNQAALDFLLTRRSYPPKLMQGAVPSNDELNVILTAASRTPDHGKLEPWRFIVLAPAALKRLSDAMPERGADLGVDPEKIAKTTALYANAKLAVAVVSCPTPSDKVPQIEQVYAAGGACLALVNAALASGYGASWMSGWFSHDRTFITDQLGLAARENIAGIVHIGSRTNPPPERPRPDLTKIVEWVTL